MSKRFHRILNNIHGGKQLVGTVEIPFRLLCTVYRSSSIKEKKMHTETVCVCVLVLPILWGPNIPTSIVISVNSPYGNIFRSP